MGKRFLKKLLTVLLTVVLIGVLYTAPVFALTPEEYALAQQAIQDGALSSMDDLEMMTALLWPNCIDPNTGKKWGEIKGTFNSPYIASSDSGFKGKSPSQKAKEAYNATATPLQKKVQAIIDKHENGDLTAGAQITSLMAANPNWSVNYEIPMTTSLLPGHILVKTGYRLDQWHVGDNKPYMWVLENGELCGCDMSIYPDIVAAGGFTAYANRPRPKSGVFYSDGKPVYWSVD